MSRCLVLLLAVLAATGCSQSSSPPPHPAVIVAGGTPAMRARARDILERMTATPIARVQFQRPPFAFAQYVRVRRPRWMTVTVRAPGGLGTSAASWATGYADIFERAYQAVVPRGGYGLLGTSEQRLWDGHIHYEGGGVNSVPSWAVAKRTPAGVIRTVRSAAGRSGFTVSSLRVFPLDRLAAATVLTVRSHRDFPSRLNTFEAAMRRLGFATDGVQWQIRDQCGNVVAEADAGMYVNPRWECPDPFAMGFLTPKGACRKLAAQQPACGAA